MITLLVVLYVKMVYLVSVTVVLWYNIPLLGEVRRGGGSTGSLKIFP